MTEQLEKTNYKMAESLIQKKFIEVPTGVNLQDKIALLNVWLSDMQRNGFNILSTSNIQRIEQLNGTFIEGFEVEYREMN